MRISRRRLGWAITLVAVGGVATAAMWPKPQTVDVAPAARSTLRVTVNAEARTRTESRFVVAAPVTGRLQRIRLEPGDVVRLGVVIATIAPLPLDAASVEAARSRFTGAVEAQRDAESRVRQARETSLLADRVLQRYRAVESAGGVSRQDREELELAALMRAEDVAAAEYRARAAAAEVRAARAALPQQGENGFARSVIVQAPIAGRVLTVPEPSERIVTAGAPILELGPVADLEIVADVLSEDAVRVQPGAPVELAGWGGDVLLQGIVRTIEPAAETRISALGVDEQRVNVIIAPATVPRRLGDGYRLDARITIWEGRDVLSVPPSAVFTTGAESRVFVVAGGRARERVVRVGQRSDDAVQILGGVEAGELVVLFPSDRITTGTRVRHRLVARASLAGGV